MIDYVVFMKPRGEVAHSCLRTPLPSYYSYILPNRMEEFKFFYWPYGRPEGALHFSFFS